MRILFLGTPEYALPSLFMLKNEGYEIVAAVTQPDRPKGRGYQLVPCAVKAAAIDLGIPVWQPEKIRTEESLEILRSMAPNLMVTAAYGQILSQAVLDVPTNGVVNVHGSLLPQYRGAAPIQWAVINGEKETGVTTMLTERGIDTGNILLAKKTPIGPNETAGELYDRLAVLGAEVLKDTLCAMASGSLASVPQDHAAATHYPMLAKEHGLIDWNKKAMEIHNRVRGVNPWPGAFTFMEDKLLKIWAAQPIPESHELQPGTVVRAGEEGLVVAAGEGMLVITELQWPGKKRMAAKAFLRGHSIKLGTLCHREAH